MEQIREELHKTVLNLYGLDIPVKVWYDKKRGVYASNIAFEVSKLLNQRLQ